MWLIYVDFDVSSPEDENMDITRRLYEEEAKKAQQEAWEHSLVEQRDPIRGFTVCHAIQASDCMHYIGMSHVIHMSLLINLILAPRKITLTWNLPSGNPNHLYTKCILQSSVSSQAQQLKTEARRRKCSKCGTRDSVNQHVSTELADMQTLVNSLVK